MTAELQAAFDRALEAACLGKLPHASESAAMAAQAFWVRIGVTRSGDELTAYECRFCGKWHLGH